MPPCAGDNGWTCLNTESVDLPFLGLEGVYADLHLPRYSVRAHSCLACPSRGRVMKLAYGVAREPDGVPRRVLPRWARGGRPRGLARRQPGPPLPVGRAGPA